MRVKKQWLMKTGGLLALAVCLTIASPAAFAQNVFVDGNSYSTSYGNQHNNYSSVGTVTVNYAGYMRNRDTGRIASATVNSGGSLSNMGTAHIESVNVDDSGNLYNYDNARIESVISIGGLNNTDNAHVESITVGGSWGYFENDREATIGSATINGWKSANYGSATIRSVTINGGGLNNYNYAHIETATLNGGWLSNYGNATIGSVTVKGGELWNRGSTTIGTMTLSGGTVENGSRINQMAYAEGIYSGTYNGQTGTVGTLTLAGNSAGNTGNWGTIENLQFADDGSGTLTITAGPPLTRSAAFSFTCDIQPTESVNFDHANICIDLAGFEEEGTAFSLADIFGGLDVSGTLNSLSIGGEQFKSVGSDWVFTFDGNSWNSDSIPEPATMSLLALGGLALSRRRK